MRKKEVAKEITISFKCDEKLADLLKSSAFDLDMSASEIIRACILLSLETIKAMPALVSILDFRLRAEQ